MSANELFNVGYALMAEGSESVETLELSLRPPGATNDPEEQATRRALIASYGGAVR